MTDIPNVSLLPQIKHTIDNYIIMIQIFFLSQTTNMHNYMCCMVIGMLCIINCPNYEHAQLYVLYGHWHVMYYQLP